MENMHDHLYEAINKLTMNLLDEKKRVITERVFERVGLNFFDLEDELQKKFPRIKCVNVNDCESWFWNDGSDLGLLLVRFFTTNDFPKKEDCGLTFKMTMEIKYL